MKYRDVTFSLVLLILCSRSLATPAYRVAVDLSDLGGVDFQLQAALYDNSGVIGDSWILMDNVTVGLAKDNFETGTLEGVNNSFNPASAGLVAGSLDGTGGFLLRIDEDPVVTPTIVYRDYGSPGGAVLSFDCEAVASDTVGFWGKDQLVLSLLSPETLDPLVPGLTGLGDVLAISAGTIDYTDAVTVTTMQPIPAPAAWVLGLIGLAGLRFWRRQLCLI